MKKIDAEIYGYGGASKGSQNKKRKISKLRMREIYNEFFALFNEIKSKREKEQGRYGAKKYAAEYVASEINKKYKIGRAHV